MLLDRECEITIPGGPTGAYDDYGDPIIEPPSKVTVACWWDIGGSTEDLAGAKEQSEHDFTLYLAEGTRIIKGSTVVLLGTGDTTSYRVVGKPSAMPGGIITPGFVVCKIKDVEG